jgi:hypothetical protein
VKRLFGISIALLASVFVATVIGEVALRAIGFSAPIWWQPDEQLGWRLRPGAKGWSDTEGRAYVQVSPAGFRDRTHDLHKPMNAYRIAVLGDSYAEAMQVEFKATFWWQLQEKLAACAPRGREVEVMNFGVSGYGTAQEALVLESTAIKYRPDMVLLAFTNGNDLADNSPKLATKKDQPFYRLDGAKNLRLDASFSQGDDFRSHVSPWLDHYRAASDKLRVVQMVHQAKKTISAIRAGSAHAGEGAQKAPNGVAGAEPGTKLAALAPPRDAAWEEAWAVTERMIARMNAFAARNQARFAMTTVTHGVQLHPDAGVRRNVQDALGVEDLFYIEKRMEALGGKEGFPVIALAPEMQRRADAERAYFHGFKNIGMGIGHWNEDGHRVAAEILARRLCAEAF